MPQYLIFYDIAQPKRLRKIARIAEGYGLRLQKSVFWGALSEADFLRFYDALERTLDPEEDAITTLQLCERCASKMKHMGKKPGHKPDDACIIV